MADIRLPGILLGFGLGGFLDGIVLHQLLQWHHMLTSAGHDAETVAGLKTNTFWDGLFHALCWVAVVAGLAVLKPRGWSSRALWGWALVGWGLFNLVEGAVNHHVLGIHHVREGHHELWWDIGFLVLGALLVVGGHALQRGERRTYLTP